MQKIASVQLTAVSHAHARMHTRVQTDTSTPVMPPKKRDGAAAVGQGGRAPNQSSRARTREREAAVVADGRARVFDNGLQALSPAALCAARQAMARYVVGG